MTTFYHLINISTLKTNNIYNRAYLNCLHVVAKVLPNDMN